jgi:AraC family transcriptional regulator, regulatory protein of adaptative response / methylated-DNA-[protein]-cysteine methyltransferase
MKARRIEAATADPRWRAIAARDAASDGRFFYSVRTTGVYCRPSCPSRLAKPENVAFHATAEAAEQAGYRPCRRCRPDQATGDARRACLITGLCRYIDGCEHKPSLQELSRYAQLSPYHLHRLFRAATGITPAAYAAAARAARLRAALGDRGTITDALYRAGFGSSSRFYDATRAALGMTASRFRKGGADSILQFATGRCSLGWVLAAASDRGLCAIFLGENPEALLQQLHARYPRARLLPAGPEFADSLAAVVRLIEAPASGLALPLDIRGTAFQQQVWKALQALPAGAPVSYTELARRIGQPGAVRAVARACGANPLAVAIPCHRVLAADGTLAGYRWGIERKRVLLEREAAGKGHSRTRSQAKAPLPSSDGGQEKDTKASVNTGSSRRPPR